MKLLIATRNPGKFSEIKAMFDALSTRGVELLSLQDLAIFEDCVEDGATFQENSLKKARFYSELSGFPTVADDSGLLVNALRGELGVQTRRWGAGENATDEEWLQVFMNRMESEVDRSAHFVSVASYFDGHSAQSFVGETRGSIAEHVLAPIKHGIPLSSVFIPEGMHQAYSQLSFEEKARISHRGKAFSQLLAFLEEIL